MNNKTKKSSNHKALIIIFSVIIFIVGISVGSYFVVKNYMTNRALDYLTEKYSTKAEDYTINDYSMPHYYIYNNDQFFDWMHIGRSDFKWEFEYNGRKFFVNREDGALYDDYQLEDIEKWELEWLQDNIDENIICVTNNSYSIYSYQNKYFTNSYLLTENDIESFLEFSFQYTTVEIAFYDSTINEYNEWTQKTTEMINSIKNTIKTNYQKFSIPFVSPTKRKSFPIKVFKDHTWCRCIEVE